ncbi:hypothetical protein AB0G54_19485 [Streptomyces yokosukanensis]|uniref:hypothetical protein n=1 Tax=Streptomyces yokosukanensis TaxID=67386 RepID=UPI0034461674
MLLDYAALLATGASVRLLALEALQRAVLDTRTAAGTDQPPLHHPLLLAERTARVWAGTTRRSELSAAFVSWLDRTPHPLPGPPSTEPSCAHPGTISWAYHRLPRRTQAVLWHTVVQRDDSLSAGRSLDVHPDRVSQLRRSALEELRHICMDHHAERSDNGHCRLFGSLLEAATRLRGPYPSADLDQHLADCRACSLAHSELTGINERPGALLADALLPWGGAAFAAARGRRPAHARSESMPHTVGHAGPRTATAPTLPRLWQGSRRHPTTSVAAAVGILAAAATALHLSLHSHDTGAARPVPADSVRTTPHPSDAPHPSRGAPRGRSAGHRDGQVGAGGAATTVPGRIPSAPEAHVFSVPPTCGRQVRRNSPLPPKT